MMEERRKTQDVAQVFKIVKGIDKIDPEKIFPATRQYLPKHNWLILRI